MNEPWFLGITATITSTHLIVERKVATVHTAHRLNTFTPHFTVILLEYSSGRESENLHLARHRHDFGWGVALD